MAKESPFYQNGETYTTVNKFIQSNTHSFCQEVQNWASTRPKNADSSPLVSEKTSWIDVAEDLKTIQPFVVLQQEEICNYLGKASIQWVSITILSIENFTNYINLANYIQCKTNGN